MAPLRDLVASSPATVLAIGGLIIGLAFGYIVMRTNFCTMGSISDIASFGDYRRFRAWLLAAATAIAGTQLAAAAGAVDLGKSMYLGANLNVVGHIVGGLMFGYGMVFAGGCASRNLARIGAGDLRSLLTLIVMGLAAYMTIGGLLGPLRAWAEQATNLSLAAIGASTQSIGSIVGAALNTSAAAVNAVAAVLIVAGVVAYCVMDKSFRTSPPHIAAGIGIGLCAAAGWMLTGLGYDEIAARPVAPISLTFVRPTGDAIEWLERFTAGMMPGFGVATVFGAILGSFIAARAMGRFRLTTFSDVSDTKRNLFGGMLMGIGGVLGLGCTIGQGITGVSTLALGSFITFAAIVAGGFLGMKRMEQTLMAEI
ncbi:MAG: YeeE/YedE family protein [Hyphomicrobiaceae bacterium]